MTIGIDDGTVLIDAALVGDLLGQPNSRTIAPQPPHSFIHGNLGKPCRKPGLIEKAVQMGKPVT